MSSAMQASKDTATTTGYLSSDVFGRKKSWSDQVADSHLLHNGTKSNKSNTSMNGISNTGNGYHHTGALSNDVKFVNSTMEILQDQIKREEAPKKKRTRTTIEQLRILQRAFLTDPMPNSNARVALAKRLGMTARAVQVWFQNRRAKEKLEAKRVVQGTQGSSAFVHARNSLYDDDDLEDLDAQSYDSSEDIEPQEPRGILPQVPRPRAPGTTGPPGISADLLSSLKANGMLSRLAFDPAKPSLPAPTAQPTYMHSQLPGYFPSAPFPKVPSPGPFLLDSIHDPSVDQLYQDLGASGGLISPPAMPFALHTQNHPQRHFGTSTASAYAMFAFGEPFFAAGGDGPGGVDRTPSVSPVGFMMLGNSASTGNRAYSLPVASPFDMLPAFPCASLERPVSPTGNESQAPGPGGASDFSAAYRLPTCGNVCLSSTVLGPSSSPTGPSLSPIGTSAPRRSFSLPEAHTSLTSQQMQHLESFGMQIFPSPLMSIHEEDTATSFDPLVVDTTPASSAAKSRRMSEGSLVAASIDANNLVAFSEFLENSPPPQSATDSDLVPR